VVANDIDGDLITAGEKKRREIKARKSLTQTREKDTLARLAAFQTKVNNNNNNRALVVDVIRFTHLRTLCGYSLNAPFGRYMGMLIPSRLDGGEVQTNNACTIRKCSSVQSIYGVCKHAKIV
jgi:hypothetical protein